MITQPVICVAGVNVVVNPYQPGRDKQLLERKGIAIVERRDNNTVFDIYSKKINVIYK